VYLRDQKSVSPQEFDEVEAKSRSAQAGLEQAEARLQQAKAGETQAESELRAAGEVVGYARIRAPFDGRVVRRLIEPGTVVMPGMQLFVLEKIGEFQLEVTLPSEMLTAGANQKALKRGTATDVRLDAIPGEAFVGKVEEIEGGADPTTHTVKARIDLPRDGEIQSGMFGRASFQRGERQAIVVPESAIVEQGQLRELYVLDGNGVARLRLVTLGQEIGKLREVLSGLGAGEQIVTDASGRELDGKKVEASP
jgi:RND family efflux transporter MFP subunit